jgi:hypothetical protein
LTIGGGKALGKAVPKGDCAIDPVAEDGVTLPEWVPVPDIFGIEKDGAEGI